MAPVTTDVEDRSGPEKPLRADAQRNYDKLIAAAREAFAERGSEASLDDIAKRAGVGPGTLYRHFPTRDALIDAVMREWVLRVQSDSKAVIASDAEPREALAAWFTDFIGHLSIYRGAAAKFVACMDDPSTPIFRKCQVMSAANDDVLSHIAKSGILRDDVDSREVMRMVSGVAAVVDQASLKPKDAEPMLTIILNGITRP